MNHNHQRPAAETNATGAIEATVAAEQNQIVIVTMTTTAATTITLTENCFNNTCSNIVMCDVLHATAASSQAIVVVAIRIFIHICLHTYSQSGGMRNIMAWTWLAVGRQRVNLLVTQTMNFQPRQVNMQAHAYTYLGNHTHSYICTRLDVTWMQARGCCGVGNLHSVHGV
ncbi:unnamed protein product [Ceratitis capitata]|uniref:(Mediterranean fruit fly) hypothetical protein n=1 Tax=Ceratitis capitata TaxID=7213 RepID=A0A811UMM5_CERCA|nr:unnamed protein product [Ceratitis capitata]